MSSIGNIKVLIVDDLPEKLLVYRSVLESPELSLHVARSGAEALREVLNNDFAVILLDVNMPDLDGYETAGMIRMRKRSAHTPIIFITAYADELHALKGYAYGAVDYILAPVAPDVLRTKVRVFVDLFRKTLEIKEQAEMVRELQAREHQRQLSEATRRLELALQAGRMGACEWDLSLKLVSWSPALEAVFGFEPGTFSGSAADLQARIHPDDRARVHHALEQAVRTGSEVQLEHRINRPGGEMAWIEFRGCVISGGEEGRRARLAAVCLDITDRKRVEADLAHRSDRLEELVRERTAELRASHEQLRLSDRLASIGTLAAGLGHDMGNLLLPIRARLASLEKLTLPAPAQEDVAAIKTASEYLRRLSQGLRLFALDPKESSHFECTMLASWWLEVEPFLRNTLPKSVRLASDIGAELPAIAIAPHTFTQVVYNLVQNAGDSMKERGHGTVRISASRATDRPGWVVVEVADDGPGMSEEVRERCMEPFFTTRGRRISTGLGLALVHGAVNNVRGSISIDSKLGEGTTFRLALPTALASRVTANGQAPGGAALVHLKNARLAAYVGSLLKGLHIEVQTGAWSAESQARLLVIDAADTDDKSLVKFLDADPIRRAVVSGAIGCEHEQIIPVAEDAMPSQLRAALHRALSAEPSGRREVVHT